MPRTGFAFRLRFLTSNFPFAPDHDALLLWEDLDTVVTIRSATGKALGESEWLIMTGKVFETEKQALEAGADWRDRLGRVLAAFHLPADFGERSLKGGFGRGVRESMSETAGFPVFHETHGLMAIPTGRVGFLNSSGTVRVPTDLDHFTASVADVANRKLTDRERLAFDFYSTAAMADSPDAALVMYVTAVEALAPEVERDDAVVQLVNSLMKTIAQSELESEVRTTSSRKSWIPQG